MEANRAGSFDDSEAVNERAGSKRWNGEEKGVKTLGVECLDGCLVPEEVGERD